MALGDRRIHLAGDTGISLARSRLGYEPVRRLHDEAVGPVSTPRKRGAWYRQWRTVSLDDRSLDMANEEAFGRPTASRGHSSFPKLRFVALVEECTQVLFGTRMGAHGESELALSLSQGRLASPTTKDCLGCYLGTTVANERSLSALLCRLPLFDPVTSQCCTHRICR